MEVHSKLQSLNIEEDSRIAGVVVKYVDISRNTGGEGDCLVKY